MVGTTRPFQDATAFSFTFQALAGIGSILEPFELIVLEKVVRNFRAISFWDVYRFDIFEIYNIHLFRRIWQGIDLSELSFDLIELSRVNLSFLPGLIELFNVPLNHVLYLGLDGWLSLVYSVETIECVLPHLMRLLLFNVWLVYVLNQFPNQLCVFTNDVSDEESVADHAVIIREEIVEKLYEL